MPPSDPRPDNSNQDYPSATTGVSGGVKVDAEQTHIGGDAVGRDKITQNTWIRQLILKPWAWIVGIAVLVIGLIFVAGIFNIGPLQTLFPKPMPTMSVIPNEVRNL